MHTHFKKSDPQVETQKELNKSSIVPPPKDTIFYILFSSVLIAVLKIIACKRLSVQFCLLLFPHTGNNHKHYFTRLHFDSF